MTDSPRDARSIVDEALKLASPGQRRALLEQACQGDDHLLREALSILESFEATGSLERHVQETDRTATYANESLLSIEAGSMIDFRWPGFGLRTCRNLTR